MKTILNTISKWIDVAVRWVFISSQDPQKASGSVKFALVGLIPLAIKAGAVACGLGLACLSFLNADWLNTLIAIIGDVVYYASGLVFVLGTAYAFFRKVSATVKGTNAALQG